MKALEVVDDALVDSHSPSAFAEELLSVAVDGAKLKEKEYTALAAEADIGAMTADTDTTGETEFDVDDGAVDEKYVETSKASSSERI